MAEHIPSQTIHVSGHQFSFRRVVFTEDLFKMRVNERNELEAFPDILRKFSEVKKLSPVQIFELAWLQTELELIGQQEFLLPES